MWILSYVNWHPANEQGLTITAGNNVHVLHALSSILDQDDKKWHDIGSKYYRINSIMKIEI